MPFSVESHGTLGKPATKLIEWLAHFGYPDQQTQRGPMDVDGLRSSLISRTYARISAALALGNGSRFVVFAQHWAAAKAVSLLERE